MGMAIMGAICARHGAEQGMREIVSEGQVAKARGKAGNKSVGQ